MFASARDVMLVFVHLDVQYSIGIPGVNPPSVIMIVVMLSTRLRKPQPLHVPFELLLSDLCSQSVTGIYPVNSLLVNNDCRIWVHHGLVWV